MKNHTALLASLLLLLTACGKKAEPPAPAVAPEAAHAPTSASTAPPAEAVAGKEAPKDSVHQGIPQKDPHAGLERQAINAGTGRKGKVAETMNAAGYTYIRVEDKGVSTWLAVMEVPVKVGDVVEYPEVPPMTGFRSKTLNRTFDAILFVPGIRIEKGK